MSAQAHIRSENDVVSNFAVMPDMHIRHQHIFVADVGRFALAARPVNSDKLAYDVVIANNDVTLFAAKRDILFEQ